MPLKGEQNKPIHPVVFNVEVDPIMNVFLFFLFKWRNPERDHHCSRERKKHLLHCQYEKVSKSVLFVISSLLSWKSLPATLG